MTIPNSDILRLREVVARYYLTEGFDYEYNSLYDIWGMVNNLAARVHSLTSQIDDAHIEGPL